MTAKDRQGVQCDFCHRGVDPDYKPGISPPRDQIVLDSLDAIPHTHANGQFVSDPDPIQRGPYSDADASHLFLESPFHREAAICGTCHDVSNPALANLGLSPLPDQSGGADLITEQYSAFRYFHVERTFSEFMLSSYAQAGGAATNTEFEALSGIGWVAKCQDCHMRDGVGKACTEAFVSSFLAILALDFALAVIFKGIYETIWGVHIFM